jgi:hypothetical protein
VASVDSPEVDTAFVIAPEGLATSTTTGALTTTYGYDAGFRLGFVQSSGMNATTFTPMICTERGCAWTADPPM